MEINNFFENYLKKESIFVDKRTLMPSYIPEEILYREEQLQEVANVLAPILRMEKPSNLFIYGKTGTGKTISVKHIITSMSTIAAQNHLPLKCI